MAEETTTKIINIELQSDDLIGKIQELQYELERTKRTRKELDEELKAGTMTEDEYARAVIDLTAAQKSYQTQMRGVQKELQTTKTLEGQKLDNYNKQQTALSLMLQKYKQLTAAQKKSATGAEMLKNIEDTTASLKEQDAAMGVFNRNVGDYEGAILRAVGVSGKFNSALTQFAQLPVKGQMQALGNGIKAFSESLLSLLANPIVAIIAAVVLAFKMLIDLFKSSEDQTNKLKSAFAPFVGIFNAVKNALQGFSEKIADFIANAAGKLLDWATKTGRAIAGLFGKTEEFDRFANKVAESAEANKKATDDQIKLTKREREMIVENAKIESEIAQLREKAKRKDIYTTEEQLGFIKKAMDLTEKQAANERSIAYDKWKILKAQAAQTQNNGETNQQLAEAEAAYIQAGNKLYETRRRMSSEYANTVAALRKEEEDAARNILIVARRVEDATLSIRADGAEKQIAIIKTRTAREIEDLKSVTDSGKYTAEQYAALLEEITVKSQQEINAVTTAASKSTYDSEVKAAEAFWAQRLLTAKLNGADIASVEIDIARDKYNYLTSLDADHKQLLYANEDAYNTAVLQAAVDLHDKQIKLNDDEARKQQESIARIRQNAGAAQAAFMSMLSSFQGLLQGMGEENERYAKLARALAVFQIGVNTAQGIAEAIKSGAGVPFPANLLAIATGVSTVLAGIAEAWSVLRSSGSTPKYHTGGVVSGSGEVSATLLGGESVMTQGATATFAPLLSQLNMATGGNAISVPAESNYGTDYLASVMRQALASMPSPVVSVVDINAGQRRVETISRLAHR